MKKEITLTVPALPDSGFQPAVLCNDRYVGTAKGLPRTLPEACTLIDRFKSGVKARLAQRLRKI